MLYEKDSPPLQSYYSPRWNTSRQNHTRTRAIIIIGVVIMMLTSVSLLNHYSSAPRTDLSGLKGLNDVENIDILSDSPQSTDNTVDAVLPIESALQDDVPITPEVANSTLDFGKIYVLNLEAREDRHDEMALIAAASGLQLNFVAGVDSKTLEKQALPDNYGTPHILLEPAHLACYRGHANIWRKIVEEGIDTALIMEDDVDWDLNIREIVPRVKEAMGRIIKESNPFSNTPGKTLWLTMLISSMGFIISRNML